MFSHDPNARDSCLNGWTCGNIAVAPIDAARSVLASFFGLKTKAPIMCSVAPCIRFHWSLHHGKFISNESLEDVCAIERMIFSLVAQRD